MIRAVILSAVRTPVGRYGGGLAGVRPDDLAAAVVAAAVERAGVDPAEIEDVWLGCANQAGEDNRNVARFAALLAGLPESVGGITVNRLCASGLSAVVGACHAVVAGAGDLFVAGGVESMSRAPLVTPKAEGAFPRGDRTLHDTTLGWRFVNPRYEERYSREPMGGTGENVAERWGVEREDQDAFALASQQRWAAADAAGSFGDELVPAGGLEWDEHPRPETTLEVLGTLQPAFRHGGTVTAGNSSGISDGAAALVIASEERARSLGLEPLAVFAGSAVAGVDPAVMGIGPVPAVRKLLARTGTTVDEIDLVELNEAFASQSLAVMRELGFDPAKVNVNGGAIAIGHPLGMSGARLVVSLVHELRRRKARLGLATLCVGVGQGEAALFARARGRASAEPVPSRFERG
jgi:3-oxoadipyl-CoA thiolase